MKDNTHLIRSENDYSGSLNIDVTNNINKILYSFFFLFIGYCNSMVRMQKQIDRAVAVNQLYFDD